MKRSLLLGSILAMLVAGSAFGFGQLPAGGQVNNDPTAGIDPSRGVSGDDPANADVVGGALTAGKVAVPWAIFRQTTAGHDQVFSRSFAGGAWTTRGSGTVGGSSSSAPTFPGSLNFDQLQDGEAPSIDFAGAGRTVPWATWYEDTAAFGGDGQVFASRFDNSSDATQGKWIFSGQSRGMSTGSVPVPSLNIHTSDEAENPAVAGGSTSDPSKPGPWVTWQEQDAPENTFQIFAVKPLGPGRTDCTGVTPASTDPNAPPDGGFCWQQVGLPRVGTGNNDPSLNVDPTRIGKEPDIAFTGANDALPWVVWYETGASKIGGPGANGLVFAAKAVGDGTAQGGLHWVAVGSELQGTLDTSGPTNHFGACAESGATQAQCSLNKDPSSDAEDPRVAAGTMDPSGPTVPWVVWDEQVGGARQVFVSRLVGTGSTAHFELANGGAPISTGSGDSTLPDITFSGHTPYVSWREDVGGGVQRASLGHFGGSASAPTFQLDDSTVPLTPSSQADVREPISSSCTASPFNQDGESCQGKRHRDPVLPVHERDQRARAIRRCLPARRPHHRCTVRDLDVGRNPERHRRSDWGIGQRLLPIRRHDGLRPDDGRAGDRSGQRLHALRRGAKRPRAGHYDPLPGGRRKRLRDVDRRRSDDDDGDSAPAPAPAATTARAATTATAAPSETAGTAGARQADRRAGESVW